MKKILVLLMLPWLTGWGGTVLFENGRTEWRIYLPEKPSAVELTAAKELGDYLQKAGCVLPVNRGGAVPAGKAIVIGTPEDMPAIKAVEKELQLDRGGEQKCAVYTLNGNLYLAGRTDRGVLHAVYTFLRDTVGVRWFWPDNEPGGEFVPARQALELPELAYNKDPEIRYRGYHFLNGTDRKLETWLARNFGNIIRHGRAGGAERIAERSALGFYVLNSGHNIDAKFLKLDPKKALEEHPDWFAELQGKRSAAQLCWNSSGAEDYVVNYFTEFMKEFPEIEILGFYPSDNQSYCTCAQCRKVDVSTNWFRFLRRLSDRLKKAHPELRFASIAYQGYIDYPKCDVSGYEFIEYAPYGRCFAHKIADNCEVNARELKKWGPWLKSGIPTGIYGYEFDIFDPVIMVPLYSWLSDQTRFFRDNNVAAVMPEVSGTYSASWGPSRVRMRLAFYLYSRLMWEPDADVDALIRDFCNYVYPAAAEEMYRYHTMLDRSWNSQRRHFSGYGATPVLGTAELLSPEIVGEARELFRAAAGKVSGERERKQLEFEQDLFGKLVDYYWQNSDSMVNVPRSSSPEYAIRWTADSVTVKVDGTPQKITLTSPNGEVRTQSGNEVTFPDKLKAGDCRQLKIGGNPETVLYFNKLERVEKSVLISIPEAEIARKNRFGLRSKLMEGGWQVSLSTDPGSMAGRRLDGFDIVAVRMNENKLPESCYRTELLEYVKNGGLLVLGADGEFNFERIFGSRDFALNWTGNQYYAWRLRKTQEMQPGDWLSKPDDLEKSLKLYCTPYSGYHIPAGSKWQMLATMRKKDGTKAPYILEMPYGKGRIVLTTGSLGLEQDGAWMVFGSAHQNTVVEFFNNLHSLEK